MLRIENLHSIGTEIENAFCLRAAPLAIKLINRDEVPEKCVQPSQEGKHYALCQALAFVRRTRNHLAMFAEDHWCVWPVINFRLREVDEEDKKYLGSNYFIRDPQKSYEHFVQEFPYIDPDRQKDGMAIAPLTDCAFVPDAIMLYCDPSQLRQFLMAAKYDSAKITQASFDTCDSCGAALLPILNGSMEYNVSIPDAGEYERGLCTENEMIFTLSMDKLEAFITAVRELIAKGFSYKQLAYDLKADYSRPKFYNDMFEKWGLKTGEEWIPGQR